MRDKRPTRWYLNLTALISHGARKQESLPSNDVTAMLDFVLVWILYRVSHKNLVRRRDFDTEKTNWEFDTDSSGSVFDISGIAVQHAVHLDQFATQLGKCVAVLSHRSIHLILLRKYFSIFISNTDQDHRNLERKFL